MDSIEADGSSIDEAIDNALKSLGAPRDRVEIEILSNTARGLFGIGGRRARVRATLRSPIDVAVISAPPSPTPVRPTPQNGDTGAGALPPSAVIARATQVLEEILKHINVPASVLAKTENEHVVIELAGDASGVLIGRRGQMLDALEYLINRVVGHDDENRPPRIIVDSEGYRARRQQALEDLARRMGAQAKRKRRPVTLNPLSPRDRRIIHMMLRTDPSLTTKSSGKGYFRRLIIIPAGAGRAGRDDE